MIECERLPLVPVIRTVYVPVGVDLREVEIDNVAVPPVAGFGVNEPVALPGSPLTVKAIDPVNPFRRAIVTLNVVLWPPLIDRVVGLDESEKSVTDTLAVPVTVPLAAVTLNGPPALEPARNNPLASIVPPPDTDQP